MANGNIVETASGDSGKGEGYLSLVDGLRGFAAFAVLFYHYVHFFMAGSNRRAPVGSVETFPANDLLWPLYQYGYFAVQIFWLISGFVFAHVYYRRRATGRDFLVSRFARLYPLHLLTLAIVTLLQLIAVERLGYTPIYANYDLQHFSAQLFMASDWISQDGGYAFNGPIWSVSVEIAIYALFWVSCTVIARFGPVLALVMAIGLYFLDSYFGEYSKVFVCGFYFFAGCGLSLLRQRSWASGASLTLIIGLLAVIGIGGFSSGSDWAWRYLGIPGLFGALILLLANLEGRAPAPLRKGCEWLGENTYGIYLWHFPIQLVLLLSLMPGTNPAAVARNDWFLMIFVVTVLIVARISNVAFERPMRQRLRQMLGEGAPLPALLGQKEGDILPAGR
jgi:peptidoglycan/LPS O-acetylase OafA/YrhL